ncbi:MAG: hypothetical protein SV760_07060, partial [Halobacteria archaeon]|nr:hypothetical protein [Halobacteria archaeon]
HMAGSSPWYVERFADLLADDYRLYVADSDRSLDDGWVSERTNSYINSRRGTLLFWFGVSFGYLPLVVLIVGLTYIVRTLGASEALQDAVYNAFLGTVRVSGLVASHRGDEKAETE